MVAAAGADYAFRTLVRAHPNFSTLTCIHQRRLAMEPKEEDTMATGILNDSDAEASDAEATPAPTAAESHVHEVADVEETKLSKLAALRIVYGQRPPT